MKLIRRQSSTSLFSYWLIFLWLITLSNSAFSAKKIEAAKESLTNLHERIDALKKDLSHSQEAHKDAADALKKSELAISQANKSLYDIGNQQQLKKTTLAQLKVQSSSINSTLAQQQKLLNAQLYEQYLHGQQSYTQIVLQNQDPNKIARDLHYFSYISKARASLIVQMQSNLAQVAKLNDETTQALNAVAELKKQQELERLHLQTQKQEKSKVVKSLSSQIALQRNEISKLVRDEKDLSQLVERLGRALPKASPSASKNKVTKNNTKKELNKTAEDDASTENNRENSAQNKTAVASNDELPSNAYSGENFAALKGKLNLPVRGEVMNHFGASREDSGISWKGLFIKSAEGSSVKSVASGRVVFADWMRGFGNLIIVDHGNGYMSLYGNNQAVLRKVGDNVSGGDAIASVGNSGGNEVNGLYYELRKQSKPFDPMSWSVVR